MPIPNLSPTGVPLYSGGSALAASVATLLALAALADGHNARTHGNEVLVDADGSRWYWHSSSTLTSDGILVQVPDDAPSTGRWLRAPGPVDLALPFTYATANNGVLLTLQAGAVFAFRQAYWEVTTGFTGGSSSAIGVNSSNAAASTAGDLLGGAAGDVAATLVAGAAIPGTIGARADALSELHADILVAGDTVKLNRITSAFTAGAGKVHLVGQLLRNPGA